MGLNLPGPICDLAAFAISQTYTLGRPTNRNKCMCKGCGLNLGKGQGTQVMIRAGGNRAARYYYFCGACSQVVQVAAAIYPPIPAPDTLWHVFASDAETQTPEAEAEDKNPYPGA